MISELSQTDMNSSIIIPYPEEFNFVEEVSRIFDIDDLSRIHELVPGTVVLSQPQDQKTVLHRRFYDNMAGFLEIYEKLIHQWIPGIMEEDDLIYQAVPTFRVHLPGSVAVGDFHKDSDYAHSREEINFWVPLTEAFGTNSIWIETKEDLADYRAVSVRPGEAFRFPGGILRHGNHRNETEVSRVSFDFRVVKRELFNPTGSHSASAGVEMKIGGYYKELRPR